MFWCRVVNPSYDASGVDQCADQGLCGCIKEAATKLTSDKVAAYGIEAYLRSTCSSSMNGLKSSVVAFRTKKGMSKKAAAADAEMTVDDYLATSVDKYQFMAELNAPAPAAKPAPAVQATPAAAPQPPKAEGQ